ncbi:aromatic ring-hydroxylating oxygenase subunit alpha [Pacificibacter marinus]|uniref:aromatic ring-hydroxylating oxygenase subunit alpha n=1 Tax=Pacificibacter marinus TaxID=658057 RepID=UPI001C06C298|nr:aromatic ring-hydroxylating dioxygenase subunit alpha [Pacificibacter marinus]MBU2867271.1 aromatic ring-hydroxylating dioxygenase subunit alpha [Pacificibacter marinus]
MNKNDPETNLERDISDSLRPDAVVARGPDLTDEVEHLIRKDVVHRRVYTDPDLFNIEMDRIFGATWCFIGHESEVPEPGDFVRKRLGKRQIILVRTRKGEIRGLLNRCSHRGTTLVGEEEGCAKRFTCPYHGWAFDLDGHLQSLPVADSYSKLYERPFDLGQIKVVSHRGFVFGTLAAEPMPLDEWLGPAKLWLDEHIDRHPSGSIRVLKAPIKQSYKANWKMAWDNAADGIHATFAHRSYNLLGKEAETDTILSRNPAVSPMVGYTLGHGHCVVDQRPGIPDGPWSTMRPLPTREDLEASLKERGGDIPRETWDLMTGNMVNLNIFPNLIFVGNQIVVPEPISAGETLMNYYLVMADDTPEEVNLMRMRVDEDFMSFGIPDDFEMFERVQEGLQTIEEEWVDVSRGDDAGDVVDEYGLATGDLASEAPIRHYMQEWKRIMAKPIPTTIRRARIEDSKFMKAQKLKAESAAAAVAEDVK